MNLFSRLFKSSSDISEVPKVVFGRFSDTYKSDEKYRAWDESILKFEDGLFDESFDLFFQYLSDETQQNVKWAKEGDVIRFEILQGSKKITGSIDNQIIKAEAKIATTDSLNIGFLRRMIELNYTLKYGRYALDSNDSLTLVFDSYLLDGSPYKLYYALKEIAVNADKQDDLLVSEFETLKPINIGHLGDIPDAEKAIKYQFLQKTIQSLFKTIDQSKLSVDQYAGGIAYTMLNACYKLDYLLKPEGQTMEALERIHRTYFAQDRKSTVEKNVAIRKELVKIQEKTKSEFHAELYQSSATFGITSPTNHNQFVSFVDGELPNMDWYAEHNHHAIARSIPEYIIGYCLFNYALPMPDKELLHLYYQITEPGYFTELGFESKYYDAEEKKFDRKAIKKAVERIQKKNRDKFPRFQPNVSTLDYSSIHQFAKSYLLMMRLLDLTKV